MNTSNVKFGLAVSSLVGCSWLALSSDDTINRYLFVSLALVSMALVYQHLSGIGNGRNA
ncbi:MAG: hypothetical protein RL021_663 [Bacteroidota bacterium]|jgi:hypothetical protein